MTAKANSPEASEHMEGLSENPDSQGWRPEAGDVIVGHVHALGMHPGQVTARFTSDPWAIITIARESTGELVDVHCFHASLSRQVMALRPLKGERIGICYHGKRKTKDGSAEFASYSVNIDGRAADIWETLATGKAATAGAEKDSSLPF